MNLYVITVHHKFGITQYEHKSKWPLMRLLRHVEFVYSTWDWTQIEVEVA